MILALILVSTMLIAGCTQQGTETTKTTPVTTKATVVATTVAATPAATGNQTQIANPASENCIKMGGKLDIRKNADGSEYGICTINGTECEEWALFRGECKPGAAAANVSKNVTANATIPAANATAGKATLNASKNATLNATVPANATAVNATATNATKTNKTS